MSGFKFYCRFLLVNGLVALRHGVANGEIHLGRITHARDERLRQAVDPIEIPSDPSEHRTINNAVPDHIPKRRLLRAKTDQYPGVTAEFPDRRPKEPASKNSVIFIRGAPLNVQALGARTLLEQSLELEFQKLRDNTTPMFTTAKEPLNALHPVHHHCPATVLHIQHPQIATQGESPLILWPNTIP